MGKSHQTFREETILHKFSWEQRTGGCKSQQGQHHKGKCHPGDGRTTSSQSHTHAVLAAWGACLGPRSQVTRPSRWPVRQALQTRTRRPRESHCPGGHEVAHLEHKILHKTSTNHVQQHVCKESPSSLSCAYSRNLL